MARRIGLSLMALALLAMLFAPSPAEAKVHFGVFIGPSYPVYPYPYSYYPYAYGYPGYYYDPYYYPYVYSAPYYGYWGGGYWRGYRDRDDYRGWAHHDRGFRGGERGFRGNGHAYARGRR